MTTKTNTIDASLPYFDRLTRKHTGFDTFAQMINSEASYRPTLRPKLHSAYRILADAYDLAQAMRGDPRRCYRD